MASKVRTAESDSTKTVEDETVQTKNERKSRVSQKDVPSVALDEALRVAQAIGDNYAYKASRPIDVAAALNMSPTSSTFKMLCGASIAYGFTDGGHNAAEIKVLPLTRRVLEPLEEGEDLLARREAVMQPRVLATFLNKYDGHKLPREEIARNVLASLGVPQDSTDRTLKLVLDTAQSVGFLQQIKDGVYVNLHGAVQPPLTRSDESEIVSDAEVEDSPQRTKPVQDDVASQPGLRNNTSGGGKLMGENRKVFITHGKNKGFVNSLKEVLGLVELEPVVSVERESVSLPVPDKVINDMQQCSAAIIHVDDERRLIDPNHPEEEIVVLNPNVLIEIGAAMALYGRRFILLVKEGAKLPSNLQGLYEVRYQGEKLDGDTTIRLLKAIKDIKNHPMPGNGAE